MTFPYNHYDDDGEFINVISENWNSLTCKSISMKNLPYSDLVFNPFEINMDDHALSSADIDPDLNYFNNDNSLLSNCFNSDYYTEDSLNKKLSNVLTSRCNFSLIHFNIRSAPKHISEFESYINSLQIEFSIVGFSETWFHDSNVDVYSLNGYNHEYMYRKGRLGGGVSLFIKKMIDYKIRNDLNVNNGNIFI